MCARGAGSAKPSEKTGNDPPAPGLRFCFVSGFLPGSGAEDDGEDGDDKEEEDEEEAKRMNTTTKRSTTISIDGSLLQVARERAREERRTLSAQLELWIEEKLAAVQAAASAGAVPAEDEGCGGGAGEAV